LSNIDIKQLKKAPIEVPKSRWPGGQRSSSTDRAGAAMTFAETVTPTYATMKVARDHERRCDSEMCCATGEPIKRRIRKRTIAIVPKIINGRRRPKRAQQRSLRTPTKGWTRKPANRSVV
jgi:hypothetical protein